MGILDPVKSKAYRDGLIQHAKDVDAVLAEVSEPTRQFMRKAYQLGLYPLEFARETAAKLEAFRLAARAEGAREALTEAVKIAEGYLHTEGETHKDELDRIAAYSNGTVHRIVSRLRTLRDRAQTEGPTGHHDECRQFRGQAWDCHPKCTVGAQTEGRTRP